MAEEDRDLVREAREGNRRAFQTLVESTESMVRSHCYHMLGSREEAEDAAQEVYLKAFNSRSRFRGDSSFRTWILKIARTQCFDLLRKRKYRNAYLDSEREIAKSGQMLSNSSSGAAVELTLEAQQIVGRVLRLLSTEQRS